jgi:phosphatidylglycerophosphate synthase
VKAMTNHSVFPEAATAAPAVRGPLPVGPFATVPNVVTATRTAIAVLLGAVAVGTGDLTLLAVAYGVFWVGDIADGWSARRLGQETRAGAVFDIVCDRACTGILCVGLVASVPAALPVVVVFVLSFMVLDSMLSMAFLCWPVLSPNYFHVVDRRVWQLNWSPLAKAANTAGVVGALALELFSVAFAVAVVVLGIKLWSARRVVQLLAAEGR